MNRLRTTRPVQGIRPPLVACCRCGVQLRPHDHVILVRHDLFKHEKCPRVRESSTPDRKRKHEAAR